MQNLSTSCLFLKGMNNTSVSTDDECRERESFVSPQHNMTFRETAPNSHCVDNYLINRETSGSMLVYVYVCGDVVWCVDVHIHAYISNFLFPVRF